MKTLLIALLILTSTASFAAVRHSVKPQSGDVNVSRTDGYTGYRSDYTNYNVSYQGDRKGDSNYRFEESGRKGGTYFDYTWDDRTY